MSVLENRVIEVNGLIKRYNTGDRNAVDGITFDVREGEFFALLGANGAGKTTTISILNTTLVPTEGVAKIGGYDVTQYPAAVRQEIGVIFQQPSLDLNLTAEENIRFHSILYGIYPYRPLFRLMPKSYRDKILELAELIGIREELFKPVKTYSGGMKRKLEIIRSLMHDPRVLILDEPTTGLDPVSRKNLWEYILSVRETSGTAVLLTTHYLEEAESADRICIMNRGKIASFGTRDEIKQDLVEQYLLIDALDRSRLVHELESKQIDFSVNGFVRVDLREPQIHDFLRTIETPLTVVRPHIPTLEDAYLAIVERPLTQGSEPESLEVSAV